MEKGFLLGSAEFFRARFREERNADFQRFFVADDGEDDVFPGLQFFDDGDDIGNFVVVFDLVVADGGDDVLGRNAGAGGAAVAAHAEHFDAALAGGEFRAEIGHGDFGTQVGLLARAKGFSEDVVQAAPDFGIGVLKILAAQQQARVFAVFCCPGGKVLLGVLARGE